MNTNEFPEEVKAYLEEKSGCTISDLKNTITNISFLFLEVGEHYEIEAYRGDFKRLKDLYDFLDKVE